MVSKLNISQKIKKVLIVNRGEIALRVMATAHALGIKTVAIYTEEDQFLSYVYKASEAHKLSKDGSHGYLDQEEIISIAKKSGSCAVHPGYGFLSENAEFAQKVINSGLIWVGPTPHSINLLGDKAKAQKVMNHAGVPTIPGYSIDSHKYESKMIAKQNAIHIGLPILLKCAHGGGGKAMRLVKNIDNFDTLWNTVVSESQTLFNSSTILVEKHISNPRHIEVQVAGDGENFVHMFERECSIQRRHQKIIEEAPCSFISQNIKERLFSSALRAARSVGYKSVGTVEFLVKDENIYFLEINTRLQVEHSITEQITGIDLVELQFYLAAYNKLPYTQEDISLRGHSIECRIYSEDPKTFIPSTGTITNLQIPHGPSLRIDHDLSEGQEVTPFFDPMVAKLTTYGLTRETAILHMKQALRETDISGISINKSLLLSLLSSKEFSSGDVHTQLLTPNFLERIFPEEKVTKQVLSEQEAKELESLLRVQEEPVSQKPKSRWREQSWGKSRGMSWN